MPNWCYNTLTITGKSKDLHKLVKQVKDDERVFSFEKIIPMPESEMPNWYEWRCANWNTKWNADIQYNTFDLWESGEIKIEFNEEITKPNLINASVIAQFSAWIIDILVIASFVVLTAALLVGVSGIEYKTFAKIKASFIFSSIL